MNDFTKENLILIVSWSSSRFDLVGKDNAENEGTITLSHKIQEIIVNYCEHQWVHNYSTTLECLKCNKITGSWQMMDDFTKKGTL
jgi:hypothetical protein